MIELNTHNCTASIFSLCERRMRSHIALHIYVHPGMNTLVTQIGLTWYKLSMFGTSWNLLHAQSSGELN